MRTDGRMDRHDQTNSCQNFANAPKNDTESRRGVIRPSDLPSTPVDRETLKIMFRMSRIIANVCRCRYTRLVSKMANLHQNS